MNLIKRITDKLRRKPLLVKPVVSNSAYIVVNYETKHKCIVIAINIGDCLDKLQELNLVDYHLEDCKSYDIANLHCC